jgi:hypothetical protein
MYSAALTATFAIIIAARALALWLTLARADTVVPYLIEQAVAFTAIALLVGFEAYLLWRGRLREHSPERLSFHVTVLALTVVASVLELSGKEAGAMAKYLQDHSLHLGVEAGIGARSLAHSVRGLMLTAATFGFGPMRIFFAIALVAAVVAGTVGVTSSASGGVAKGAPHSEAAARPKGH